MPLLIALAALFALAAFVPALTARIGRNTGYILGAAFLSVGVLIAHAAYTSPGDDTLTASWSWLPALGIDFSLRFDGLSALFCLLILGVGSLILAYCARYLSEDGRHTTVYMWLTLFAASMLGVVLANDVILLVVFWELTTVCSFVLISSAGPGATPSAVKAFLVTALGGLGLLTAAVLLAVAAGTTDLSVILGEPERVLSSPLAWPAGALIILAAFTKSAQLPFHSWLPGAMSAITPVSAYLHAAAMVKAGIYLLLRFSSLFAGEVAWSATLMTVGLATAVFGATWALRQHDLKALLAYSTVSQLGLLVGAIGVGTGTALAAAMLHTFAHALFKATLFMLVGIIDREAGSRDIRELSGLRRVMPVTAAVTGLAGLSLAGVPPLIGFVSKEHLYKGYLEADFAPGAGVIAVSFAILASALTFTYGMRIFYEAFGGPTLQRGLYEPAKSFLAPALVAAVAGLVLGPAISWLNPVLDRSVIAVFPDAHPHAFKLWPGFTPELGMTAIAITAGMCLFFAQSHVERVLMRIPVPGDLFQAMYRSVVRLGTFLGKPERSDSSAAYLWRPVGLLVVFAAVALWLSGTLPEVGRQATSTDLDWPLLALIAVVVVLICVARTTLVSVSMLGTLGLLVAIWFVLAGAPDVAMTLLLAEVLTAVAAVLMLAGTAVHFRRARLPQVSGSVVLAVLAGAAATIATLAFTGGREMSELGQYLLDNAKAETGGENVVNTILVDFRAVDTLGESVVIGTVTLALVLLLGKRDAPSVECAVSRPSNTVFQVASKVVGPLAIVLSAYLFFRGHYYPGGGFIASLVLGAAVAFSYMAHGRVPGAGSRFLRPGPMTAAGIVLSLGVALAATVLGDPFFTPMSTYLSLPGGISIAVSTSLLFDLGVYLIVLAMVIATVDRLGRGTLAPEAEALDASDRDQDGEQKQETKEKVS
ncbi:hydrogen gas-evolving membrane-bound hydrogenase subunit E [Streptomyces otsuchiensis]|uniref:hydrogen gas-evolving membrane-bound hydrogenase subunit E n=1 Tax=Streptomyces otsuchiensis TaxID=2681388 RepID=UPI00102FA582|nr:hydrogen gas-evolving membrane-bound hydrogenase subunit E [Streptomyces otsuchiensis]